jgi:hypothetical protein
MATPDTRSLEHRMGDWARARLPFAVAELVMFVLKQGWACLFGGLLLLAIIGTKLIWQPDLPIHRYDALFLFAIATQAVFLWKKLETWEEARVILLFHLTGTAMEWFKVDAGSWAYPEPGIFKLMGVPLFSGFMYAAVGSYMARVIRVFDMQFAPYPRFPLTVLLAAAIYVNFFATTSCPTSGWPFSWRQSRFMPAQGSGSASMTDTGGCRFPSQRSSRPSRSGWRKTSGPPRAPGSIPVRSTETSSASPSSARGICCSMWPLSP